MSEEPALDCLLACLRVRPVSRLTVDLYEAGGAPCAVIGGGRSRGRAYGGAARARRRDETAVSSSGSPHTVALAR